MLTGSFVLSEIIFKMSLPPVNFTVKIMIRQIQDELLMNLTYLLFEASVFPLHAKFCKSCFSLRSLRVPISSVKAFFFPILCRRFAWWK